MNKKELLELIDKLNDEDDVLETLSKTEIADEFKTEITLDAVKSKFKSDKEFKSYLDSEHDKYHQKAIKTMKEKGTWESEFANELKDKFPDFITDPKERQLIELQQKIEAMEKESARKDLLKEAMKYADEKKLPQSFVEKFLGEDLESTKANLDIFGKDWGIALQSAVETKIKGSSYIPPTPNGEGNTSSIGSKMAQKANQKAKAQEGVKDPWGSN